MPGWSAYLQVQLHDVQREMSYTRSELASANAAMVAQRAQAAEDTRTAAAQHAAAMVRVMPFLTVQGQHLSTTSNYSATMQDQRHLAIEA